DGRGKVSAHAWDAVSRLDAGSKFHPAWAGEPVPRLADALSLCAALGLSANVEIKPAAGYEVETGRTVARSLPSSWPSGQTLLVSSFSERALAAAAETGCPWPQALLVGAIPRDWQSRLQSLGCMALHADAARLSETRLAELLAAGVPIAAYTVNSAEEAQRCFGLGVASLFTDRLDSLGRE
ncbi:MAG: glycerophosphodiester phosphodiesterase family protein, partial [Actinomycetota bacterium]